MSWETAHSKRAKAFDSGFLREGRGPFLLSTRKRMCLGRGMDGWMDGGLNRHGKEKGPPEDRPTSDRCC